MSPRQRCSGCSLRANAARERAAWPNGQPALLNLVDLLTDRLAVPLGEGSRPAAANVVHYALGVVPGALYAGVRSSVPAISAGRGLLFGVLLWAVNDEFLNTRLRLAGPPAAYPLTTHVRGLVGHAVLGMGTELGIAILSGMARLGRRRRVA